MIEKALVNVISEVCFDKKAELCVKLKRYLILYQISRVKIHVALV